MRCRACRQGALQSVGVWSGGVDGATEGVAGRVRWCGSVGVCLWVCLRVLVSALVCGVAGCVGGVWV
jgi:hypothetical protein